MYMWYKSNLHIKGVRADMEGGMKPKAQGHYMRTAQFLKRAATGSKSVTWNKVLCDPQHRVIQFGICWRKTIKKIIISYLNLTFSLNLIALRII